VALCSLLAIANGTIELIYFVPHPGSGGAVFPPDGGKWNYGTMGYGDALFSPGDGKWNFRPHLMACAPRLSKLWWHSFLPCDKKWYYNRTRLILTISFFVFIMYFAFQETFKYKKL
jgi:hypothetical protein